MPADGGDLCPRLTWPTFLVAATSAIAVSLALGTYLARCATRLSPIDAVRHE